MKSLWIIGAGKFGIKAATVLKQKHPDVEITVVDSSDEVLSSVHDLRCNTVFVKHSLQVPRRNAFI